MVDQPYCGQRRDGVVDVIEDGHSAGTLKLDRWSYCLRVCAGSY